MDRLLRLSTYRLALKATRLGSPNAVRDAPLERRIALRGQYAPLRRLVDEAHPEVLRALFVPPDELDWLVATFGPDPADRLLSASRGRTLIVSRLYRIDDGGQGEREAWWALVGALGAAGRDELGRPDDY